MQRTRQTTVLTILMALAFALVGGWLLLRYVTRPPFAGNSTHDFGKVLINAGPVTLEHTFHLTNRTKQTISIKAVKPECGCVSVLVEPRNVGPGEVFDLPVTYSFRSPAKTVAIMMDLGEAGVQFLKVRATGRFASHLSALPASIDLTQSRSGEFGLMAEIYDSSESPGIPAFDALPELTVHFEGWQLRHESRDLRITPNQWQGRVTVERSADSVPPEAAIVVHVRSLPEITVPLTNGE